MFAVEVGDKQVFLSKILKLGTDAVSMHVDLGGGRDFTLKVGSGSDWCREAVWANARVTLRNGKQVALGELPVGEPISETNNGDAPFSFTYDGRPSNTFLGSWKRSDASAPLANGKTEERVTFSDPATGLIATLVGKTSANYPVVEWTVYLENHGSHDTPIIENLRAIDTTFARRNFGEFALHHFLGSPADPTDFEPYLSQLDPGAHLHLATSGGRSTDRAMCYFNLEQQRQGVIIALGWPGQWDADFDRDTANTVRVRAGQELTHFRLHPGEKVRTPLVALLFWNGDWLHGQNLWRRWMLADNVPHFSNGKIEPHLAASSAPWFDEMVRATAENQELFLHRYQEIGIKPDFWWMDAGWYTNDGRWVNTGTWQLDPKRFPRGMKPVTDLAHSLGEETIVWFELERVNRDTDLWKEHPDWLLQDPDNEKHGNRLLNLGLPEVQQWVVNLLDRFISEQGVDVYRIDFNFEPLAFWRDHDPPDRQGITEIRYVEGFLGYLDELKKRHPNLMIDTCASGGRRDDLETLRRAVPMHRSDYGGEPVGSQNIGYGLALWAPYFGAPDPGRDDYVFRSSWSPQINVGWDVRRPDLDYGWMRTAVAQWRSVSSDMLADYYPLLPYSSTNESWMAWQFNNPEKGRGFVQAFRRENSAVTAAHLLLHELNANATYTVTNMDSQVTQVRSGKELMSDGLDVELPEKGTSQVITYELQH
jgi:alpha-galactosidase